MIIHEGHPKFLTLPTKPFASPVTSQQLNMAKISFACFLIYGKLPNLCIRLAKKM
jgi:hypothetical protein